jgi:hypothetical protein
MKNRGTGYWSLLTALLAGTVITLQAQAATINFSGTLELIDRDNTGAVYSGLPLGTAFSGFIVDSPISGEITGGGITTVFGCCIAAGPAPVFTNNWVLTAADAGLLNAVTGPGMFNAGEVYDLVDIEGDAATAGGGRIEIGLSYLLDQNTFTGSTQTSLPPDPNDVILGLFFIIEEASNGTEIYNALGVLQPVPVPAALWLFGSGLLGLAGVARRGRARL